jgi:hypothetical protein
MSEHVVIDPASVQTYAQVVVQQTKRAGEAVGDEFLVGPSQQSFCACGELRSTIPWLDAELTEIHDQVVGGLNRVVGAAVQGLSRAVQLRQEEEAVATVATPGAAVSVAGSPVSVAPQAAAPVGNLTEAELANQIATQQFTNHQWSVILNQMGTTNPMFLPEGVDELGFDSDGNMQYTGPSGGGTSTDPYSFDLF